MKITQIRRSKNANSVQITYENGNTGSIWANVGFGADLSIEELVARFENPVYETNGFNSEFFTSMVNEFEQANDWVVEYTA